MIAVNIYICIYLAAVERNKQYIDSLHCVFQSKQIKKPRKKENNGLKRNDFIEKKKCVT